MSRFRRAGMFSALGCALILTGCGGGGSGGGSPSQPSNTIGITSVSPNAVNAQTNTTIAIHGTGFLTSGTQPGAPQVFLAQDGSSIQSTWPCTNVSIVSDTEVDCTVPWVINSNTSNVQFLAGWAPNANTKLYLHFAETYANNNYSGDYPLSDSSANTLSITNWP
jgi:hypothetical protein